MLTKSAKFQDIFGKVVQNSDLYYSHPQSVPPLSPSLPLPFTCVTKH